MKNYRNNLISDFLRHLFALTCLMTFISLATTAQNKNQMVRIAKIQVDPDQLERYNAALKEQMTTAVKLEPGVLSYHAVADKKKPANITILEVYADSAAYEKHILTPHFRKYKETVENMVKALERIDVNIIGTATKAN